MALTISQMLAVSYPLVEKKKAENQWAESSLMRKMEALGMIKRRALGTTIDTALDYQRNPDATFLATDLQPTSLTLTEVITAASYAIGQLTVPITWSKMQEAQNESETQKIALVASLLENAFESHDDLIEQALFVTSTNGFLGLPTHITTAGTGSDGGIDSSTNPFWRNQQATYADDTDIEAAFTTVSNACRKGSGSKYGPTLMVSDGATHALFEGTQQAQQRYDTQDAKAGFKTLQFQNAGYVFSPFGTTTVYLLNPKSFELVVSKTYYRDKGDTQELQNSNGFTTKIYSALQSITNNRSRLGCAHL